MSSFSTLSSARQPTSGIEEALDLVGILAAFFALGNAVLVYVARDGFLDLDPRLRCEVDETQRLLREQMGKEGAGVLERQIGILTEHLSTAAGRHVDKALRSGRRDAQAEPRLHDIPDRDRDLFGRFRRLNLKVRECDPWHRCGTQKSCVAARNSETIRVPKITIPSMASAGYGDVQVTGANCRAVEFVQTAWGMRSARGGIVGPAILKRAPR
jgi:hypothetical protein